MMNRRSIFSVVGVGAAAIAAPVLATAAVVLSPAPEPIKLWKPVTGEMVSATTMAEMIQTVEDALNRLQAKA